MVEIRVEQSGSCPKLQPVKLQTAKGSLRRPELGPLNTRYQGLGSEPQWQELIAGRIQSGQITSVNCQLKWQGQYQGHYKDQLWDYSNGLQVHKNKAHLQPQGETQMRSFQKWEKTSLPWGSWNTEAQSLTAGTTEVQGSSGNNAALLQLGFQLWGFYWW